MITSRIVNKIGLEAEILVRDNKNNLVIPNEYNMDTDDFIILGEIRSKPYCNVSDTVFEFYKDYYAYNKHAEYNKLHLDNKLGWAALSPEDYSTILRKMGNKEINQCQNIYKTDILKSSDGEYMDGKLVRQFISTGLHIHFSSDIVITNSYHVPDMYQVKQNLFVHSANDKRYEEETKSYSLLTEDVMKNMIRKLDNKLFDKYYTQEVNLKFRQKGFYEIKSWGFEYRSLPFNQNVYDNLIDIVEYCFNLLKDLEKRVK